MAGVRSGERVQRYFRAKRLQLQAMTNLAVCEHPGLVGGHREEFQRIYLQEVLPQRFKVGRGMVYGLLQRSREADIVIWDADNYPSLPMQDHAFFFAESVRVVLECKSGWSMEEFKDVLEKSRSVRDIVPDRAPSLDDELAMLRLQVYALTHGVEHEGMLICRPHIRTAAIFLQGGSNALTDLETLPQGLVEDADDCWPDLILLLEPGRVLLKRYPESGGTGYIDVYEYGEDALLVFTNGLLQLLAERTVTVEDHFYFDKYMLDVSEAQSASLAFRILRLPPERRPLWR